MPDDKLFPPVYYFDMDGVMCVYDRSHYKPAPDNGPPPYLTHGLHMFRDIPENPNVVNAFRLLYGVLPPGRCKILTSIPAGITQAEHTLDKFDWMALRVPNFRQEDFLCVTVAKHDAVAGPLSRLDAASILVDDWDKNLSNWQANGGTPVKLLNGINSPNRKMYCASAAWSAWDLMQYLVSVGEQASAWALKLAESTAPSQAPAVTQPTPG